MHMTSKLNPAMVAAGLTLAVGATPAMAKEHPTRAHDAMPHQGAYDANHSSDRADQVNHGKNRGGKYRGIGYHHGRHNPHPDSPG